LGAGGNLVRRAAGREFAYPGLRELIRNFYGAVRAGHPGATDPSGIELATRLMEEAAGGQ
jgi:hypothetical protein